MISGGTDLESLFTSQLTPVEQTNEHKVEFDSVQMMEAFRQAVVGAGPDPKAIRARIGAYALTVPTIPEAERRAIIETRLPVHTWSEQRLLIVAVDAETGEEYIMDRMSGVSLVDAVSASCAVPGNISVFFCKHSGYHPRIVIDLHLSVLFYTIYKLCNLYTCKSFQFSR